MERKFFKSLTQGSNFKELVLSALFVAFSVASFSASLPPDEMARVTSLGIQNGEMVFRIKTENLNEQRLLITLSDKDGQSLYKGIFSEKNLTKTFKVPAEIGSMTLLITNRKDKTVERYEIANEKKLMEKLVITSVR